MNILALTCVSFAMIFLSFRNDKWCFKIWPGSDWFCIRFHFFIEASFIETLLRAGMCHESGNTSFYSLLFCFRSADFLSVGLSTLAARESVSGYRNKMVLCSHFK